MKPVAFIVWSIGAAFLGFSDLADWQFVAGLFLIPLFFVGKPWYSHLKKPSKSIARK